MRNRGWIVVVGLLIAVFGVSLMSVSAQAPGGACGAGATFTVGAMNRTLNSDGRDRSYRVYVPASYDPTQPTPLVLSLHGFASNPRQQEGFSNWDMLADAEGFVVVYPAGTGFPQRWNSGLFDQAEDAVNDVQFLSELIDQVATDLCIDLSRVYINGLSNGGGMSYRFACEMADKVAAFGGVAGAYNSFGACTPSQPMPVILFHGTDDPIVPYTGGESGDPSGSVFPSVPDFAAEWGAINECAATPETIGDLPASVEGIRYTGCAADVQVLFYTILGGGHTWPGTGEPIPAFIAGVTNTDIEASALMWDFFTQYSRPQD